MGWRAYVLILTFLLQSYPPRLHPQVTNQPNPTVPSKATLRPHVHLIQHALTVIHTKSSPLINENPDNHTQTHNFWGSHHFFEYMFAILISIF